MNRTSVGWDRLSAWTVRRRVVCLIVSAGLTALFASQAPTVESSGDATEYLPRIDPEVRSFLDLSARFGAMDVLMVGLEEPGEPFTAEGLRRLGAVTDRLNGMKADGVLMARSLTNIDTARETEDGTIETDLLIPEVPKTREALAELRGRVEADGQVIGAMASRDLAGYVVLVRADNRKDCREIARKVQEAVEAERGPLHAVYFGVPFVSNFISSKVYDELPWVVPVFVAGLLVVLWVRVRRPGAIGVVLLSSGLSVVWWLGLLSLLGYRLTLTALNGALLLPVVSALVYGRDVQEWIFPAPGGRTGGPFSWRSVGLLTGVSLAFCGLAVFDALSDVSVPYLARFGEVLVVGTTGILLFGVLAFGPLASFLRPVAAPLPAAVAPRPRRLLAAALAGIAIVSGLAAAWNLRFFIAPQDLFRQDDDIGRALSFFERRFGGTDFFQVSVQGNLREPGPSRRLMRLTDLLEGSGDFADVRSITQVLGFLGKGFGGMHRIPPDRDSLANLWFFLEGREDVRQLVSDDRAEAMVVLRIPSRPGVSLGVLAGRIREAIESSADPGPDGARKRLESLVRRFGVTLPEGRIREVVSRAAGPGDTGEAADRRRKVRDRIDVYLRSPASPFAPSPEETRAIIDDLDGPVAGRVERLAARILTMPGFQATSPPPGLANDLASTLARRAADGDVELRTTALVEATYAGVPGIPPALAIRTAGAIADLVDAPASEGRPPRFLVSGFPAVQSLVESHLLHGLFVAGGILAAALGLAAFLARRRPLAVAVEVVSGMMLTLAAGWLAGIGVDSGSATLYLLAPVAAFLVSEGGTGRPGGRFSATFALALAASGASLLLTGVLPVMRVGSVMAIALVAASAVTAVSARFAPR